MAQLSDYLYSPISRLFNNRDFKIALKKQLCCVGGGGSTISGTPSYIAKFNTDGDNIEDSSIYDNGTFVGVGVDTNPSSSYMSVYSSLGLVDPDTGGILRIFLDTSYHGIQTLNGAFLALNPLGNGVVIGATSTGSSAAFEISSTTKGFLPPRVTTTQKNAISSPATGLVVYDSTLSNINFYNGSAWAGSWSTLGNSGTTAGTNFIGTTDNVDVILKRNNVISGRLNVAGYSSSFGVGALASGSFGTYNTAIGTYALTNSTGTRNTAVGAQSSDALTSGTDNVSLGYKSGSGINTGIRNTYIGTSAGFTSSGSKNTTLGYDARTASVSGDNQLNIANVIWGINCSGSGSTTAAGQISIGATTPHVSAILDLTSTSLGFGLPSMTTTQQNAISSPRAGLSVYNSTLGYPTYYNGSSWNAFFSGWGLTGNSGTSATTNFIGTTDNVDVVFKRNNVISGLLNSTNTGFGSNTIKLTATGSNNTSIGAEAGASITSGQNNTLIGYSAGTSLTGGGGNVALGRNALYFNTSGNSNIAIGNQSAQQITTADDNITIGHQSNFSNSTGIRNIGIGTLSLHTNTGSSNIGIGYQALFSNTTSTDNLAIGNESLTQSTGGINLAIGNLALKNNTTGNTNLAIGYYAGYGVTTGGTNIAIGRESLYAEGAGSNNIAIGYRSLFNNTASANYAIGNNALTSNTTGTNNIAFGSRALEGNTTGNSNIAIGYRSMLNAGTGSSNVAIGLQALYSNSSGNDNLAIGYGALQANNASYNTGVGSGSLTSNTSGNYNTAVGQSSLFYNTTGVENTTVGAGAGVNNITGSYNTFIGRGAGNANTSGTKNIYIGYAAAGYFLNDVGDKNVIIGAESRQPTPGGSNQLNINNVLWGANCTGTGDIPAGQLSVGAAVPHTSAIFDLTSTSKGLGLPQMTTSQINAISTPKSGLTVYNTDLNTICFYNGTSWQKVTSTTM